MKIKSLILYLLFLSFDCQGQVINPWLAEGINEGIANGRVNHQQYLDQASERQRQWLEEREVILRLRSMKFFGAIAVARGDVTRLNWAGGRLDKKQLESDVLKACGNDNCRVIAIFSNTCGMIAEPLGNGKVENITFAMDDDPEKAIDKAYSACEKKFGAGRCRYTGRESLS